MSKNVIKILQNKINKFQKMQLSLQLYLYIDSERTSLRNNGFIFCCYVHQYNKSYTY